MPEEMESGVARGVVVDEKRRGEIVTAFTLIAEKLEERYRKYEHISRFSKDITWESKKTISLMLKFFIDKTVLAKAEKQFQFILSSDKLFKGLVSLTCSQENYKYLRAYSPGIQEFTEALALYTFFKHRRLLTYEELLDKLTFNIANPNPPIIDEDDESPKAVVSFTVHVPRTDFLLGLTDVTGELMRACVTSLKTEYFKSFVFEACGLVKTLYDGLSCVHPTPRGMPSKLTMMRGNLIKLEFACYSLVMQLQVSPMTFKPGKNNAQEEFNETEESVYD